MQMKFYFIQLKIFINILLLFLFISLPHILFADSTEKPHKISHNDIKVGERLFKGLITTGNNTVNCASCHNTNVIDTFNWNPSALELAVLTKEMDSAVFAGRLLNPVTKKMSEVHENIQLTPEQIIQVRSYLDSMIEKGLTEKKISIFRLMFLIAMIILSLAALTDLLVTKKIKFKLVHLVIILTAAVFGTKIIVEDAIALGRSEGYAPIQPIKFSHKVHAGDNQIDCQFCHHTAESSKSAGIPSLNVCLNCHELVREGTHSGRFEISKIIAARDSNLSVEWIRIHQLADFVYFNHAQHVGVGKLACKECHGLADKMDLLYQHSDLSMGWCLDCHRTKKVDFVNNDYYGKTFKELHDDIIKGKVDSLTVAQVGGDDCMKCHY